MGFFLVTILGTATEPGSTSSTLLLAEGGLASTTEDSTTSLLALMLSHAESLATDSSYEYRQHQVVLESRSTNIKKNGKKHEKEKITFANCSTISFFSQNFSTTYAAFILFKLSAPIDTLNNMVLPIKSARRSGNMEGSD